MTITSFVIFLYEWDKQGKLVFLQRCKTRIVTSRIQSLQTWIYSLPPDICFLPDGIKLSPRPLVHLHRCIDFMFRELRSCSLKHTLTVVLCEWYWGIKCSFVGVISVLIDS